MNSQHNFLKTIFNECQAGRDQCDGVVVAFVVVVVVVVGRVIYQSPRVASVI